LNEDLKDLGKPGKQLSALDKAILTAVGQSKKLGLESDPARTEFPCLWDWLTRTGEGTEFIMQPASITILLGPEGVFATVTHRDLQVACSVACERLSDALTALEAALSDPHPPIKHWGKQEPLLRKRRKQSGGG